MNAADFAAMANPSRNPQFRRCWVGPPPRKRRSAPVAQGASIFQYGNGNNNRDANINEQVRRLQAAWGLA